MRGGLIMPRYKLNKKILLVLAAIGLLLVTSIVTAITIDQLLRKRNAPKSLYADATLFNEQIKLLYTNEAACVGNYTDDTLEPKGWELFPSIFWDSNKNGALENNESMGHTLAPSIHFTYDGQPIHFWPQHQSILQNPGDPAVISSGWINYPHIYYSEVEDPAQLIMMKTTVSVLNGNSSFTQEINITSTAPTLLTDVNLIAYFGIDINGPFDDIAFIDFLNNNMLKAYDNKTGNWFGAYPNTTATSYEISKWNDGPYEGDDLWQHTLSNTLIGTTPESGDVEAALQFNLNEIQVGETKTVTLIYSFANNESGLYTPPTVTTHDIAILNITTPRTGCPPAETVGQGQATPFNVTLENQGDYTETFNITLLANTTQIKSQQVTLNPNENATLTLIWNTTTFQKSNYTINGQIDIIDGETDIADNNYSYGWIFLTLAGDVDADRDIDIFDIVRMASIYGIVKPDPQYDPNSDLDLDGDIDIFDIVLATGKYGQSW